jgi:ATP-dependent helicase Lhr and Lhr-like helicase
VYDVYKQMEERGKIRRGYFVAEVPAMQFAQGAAVELLRSMKATDIQHSDGNTQNQAGSAGEELLWLSSVDPANAYGSLIPWPKQSVEPKPMRAVGSHVALHRGELLAWASKTGKQLLTYLPEGEPERGRAAKLLASLMIGDARTRAAQGKTELLEQIDGVPAQEHVLLPALLEAGFETTALGLRIKSPPRQFRQRREMLQNSGSSERPSQPEADETLPVPDDDRIEDEIERELLEAGLSQK